MHRVACHIQWVLSVPAFIKDACVHRALAIGHPSPRLCRWLVLPLAALVTACTPALRLPDDFWKTVALADGDGQEAQGEARILALMHLETTKTEVRALLKRVTQPLPPLPPTPSSPTPPLPPEKPDDTKQKADYEKKLQDFQTQQGKYLSQIQGIFKDQQKAAKQAADDDFDINQSSLVIFLSDDDYRRAAEAYEKARERWNALYDTVITIIGTNRDIPDWPDFRTAIKTADEDTQAFFKRYQTAKENTPKNRDGYIKQADARITEAMARLAEARDRLVVAMRRANPNALTALDFTSFAAQQSPGAASPGFSWVGSPLISGGIDLVTIFEKVGALHERERSFLQSQLQARKWPTIECLGQPEGAGCGSSSSGQNKQNTPAPGKQGNP